MADLAEIIIVLAGSLVVAGSGLAIMLASEWSLQKYGDRHDFVLEHGRFNLWRAWRPHVLRGQYLGRHVAITYSVGDYFAEGGGGTPSSVTLSLPANPPVTFRLRPALPLSKRRMRTGQRCFDWWVSMEGSPKASVLSLLKDAEVQRLVKRLVSPTLFFTSPISLTHAGHLTVRHRSLFLTRRMIERDLRVLSRLGDLVSDLARESAGEQAAQQLAAALDTCAAPQVR